jgi:hypothetical protein
MGLLIGPAGNVRVYREPQRVRDSQPNVIYEVSMISWTAHTNDEQPNQVPSEPRICLLIFPLLVRLSDCRTGETNTS